MLLGWTGASQAANCAQGSVEATRHFYSHGSPSRWYQGDYLSDQQTAQKASAEYDRMPGIDLAHIFFTATAAPRLLRRCDLLTLCFCACGAQLFVPKQSALRLPTFASALLDVFVQSWHCAPLARVVTIASSLLPCSHLSADQGCNGHAQRCVRPYREAHCSECMSCVCEGVLGTLFQEPSGRHSYAVGSRG